MLHPAADGDAGEQLGGTENIVAIPYQGIILAHSNEAEWQTFKNNKNNEAFIDRVSVVKCRTACASSRSARSTKAARDE